MKVLLNVIRVFIKIVFLIIIMGGGGYLEDRVIYFILILFNFMYLGYFDYDKKS